MKVVALISGGKDSCYNMMQCVSAGHRIVALANLRPANTDELDSYMYQTVGHQAIELYAEAMDLPLYRRTIQGSSLDTGRNYNQTEGDEVEDLYELLKLVKEKESVEAVSVGAILSDYQRVRVENVCLRLGLQPLAYLWRQDQESLLSAMISSDLHAILIKVAAFGLDPEKHLGKPLADMEPYLKQLSQKYGVHICGEGGEYETFTLDCPLFKRKLIIDAAETVIHSADAFAPVGYLRFTAMHTESKNGASQTSDVVARALPHGSCPCQNAIDKMTEEVEYADQAEDNRQEFTSNCDLSCQRGHDLPPSCSPRSSKGFQWISGINGLQSQESGIQGQTRAAFTHLKSELDSRGWKMNDIILVHLYVRSMEDFGPLNAVYKTHFGINPPARVCVQAPLPAGQLLQMDCLLHDWTEPPEEGCFHQKDALHVQSMSHWAPANIGPYSQAFRDLLWGPEIKRPPLFVATVPALPRSATVELHVTAVQDDPIKRTSQHMTTKLAYGSIECHSVMSADTSSASLSLSLTVPGNNLEVSSVKGVTDEVVATFIKAMKKMEAELVPLCARVFYKCSHSQAQGIVEGLGESLRSSLGESSPSMSLVPVLDLPDSQILHLSCWLSL
ncbi:diphthine--ammonia ligase isoform 2-T2 [Tautogolabrus adspersus]